MKGFQRLKCRLVIRKALTVYPLHQAATRAEGINEMGKEVFGGGMIWISLSWMVMYSIYINSCPGSRHENKSPHGKVKRFEQGAKFSDSNPWLLEEQIQRFPVHDAKLLPEDSLAVLRHHPVRQPVEATRQTRRDSTETLDFPQ